MAISITYFVTTVLSFLAIILAFLWLKKNNNAIFITTFLVITISAYGYFFLSISTTEEEALLANKLTYLTGTFVPMMILLCSTEVFHVKVPKKYTLICILLSTFVFCSSQTAGISQVYYKSVEIHRELGYTYLTKEYGPLHILYLILLFLYIIMELILAIYSLKHRNQTSFFYTLCIMLIPMICIIIYIVERSLHLKFELMPLVYVLFEYIMIGILLRIGKYDISNSAFLSIDESHERGFIIFDEKKRYIGSDDTAKYYFPELNNLFLDSRIPDGFIRTEFISMFDEITDDFTPIKNLSRKNRELRCNARIIKNGHRKNDFIHLIEILDDTEQQKHIQLLQDNNENLKETNVQITMQVLAALAQTIETKDKYTKGHSQRVAEYTRIIAERLGFDQERLERLHFAATLHDIGKIGVPDTILNKPDRLTNDEYNIIKMHTTMGADILQNIDAIAYAVSVAKYHHERFDGKGYPEGLSGSEIPLEARIVAIADSFDAMTSKRVYRRNSLTNAQVRDEIQKNMGFQFDPNIAMVFLKAFDDGVFDPILESSNSTSVNTTATREGSYDTSELTAECNKVFETLLSLPIVSKMVQKKIGRVIPVQEIINLCMQEAGSSTTSYFKILDYIYDISSLTGCKCYQVLITLNADGEQTYTREDLDIAMNAIDTAVFQAIQPHELHAKFGEQQYYLLLFCDKLEDVAHTNQAISNSYYKILGRSILKPSYRFELFH